MTICVFASRHGKRFCAWPIPLMIFCGSQLMGYSTVFYIAAGLPASSSFNMSLIQYALGAVGTILSWFLMTRVGRRTLHLYGTFTLFWLLLIIGFVSLAPQSSTMNWAKVRYSLSLPSHMTLWLGLQPCFESRLTHIVQITTLYCFVLYLEIHCVVLSSRNGTINEGPFLVYHDIRSTM